MIEEEKEEEEARDHVYDDIRYTIREAAALLRVHPNTIRNRIRVDQARAKDGRDMKYFPNAYRSGGGRTNPYYIPARDIKAYKDQIISAQA